jgi:uncharacterized protein (DUF427 family)
MAFYSIKVERQSRDIKVELKGRAVAGSRQELQNDRTAARVEINELRKAASFVL